MKTLEDFKDIHKDRACFIFGAGPSLHFIDTTATKDHITIAVNSGVMRARWCDYFLSDDVGVSSWSYYTELLPTLNCKSLLYKDKLANHCSHLSDVFLFEHTWWYSPKENKYNYDGLSLNKTGPIIGARTSMGSALHFAYIMGCNPIVLLGNDCKIKDGKRYFWQYNGEEAPRRVKGSPFTRGNQNFGFDPISFIEYWSALEQVNQDLMQNGLNIISCSEGVLDCFPKISFHEVIEFIDK